MALDFPSPATVGQVFQNWQWDGNEWVAANASLTYPVTVPQGGTGVVSLPAGQLVTGNGTGPVTATPFPLTVAQGGTGGTTFAPNNIPKGNASGALLASALYDTGSGLLIGGTPGGGLGAGSFNLPGPIVINKNAAALPAPPANTVLQAGGIDGSTAWVVVNAFGAAYTQSLLALRNATGTAAAPGALTNGDGVGGSIAFQGYNGSAYVSGSVIAAAANQAWGASATGTYLTFSTTAQGSTGPVNRMYLGNGLMLGSTATPDPGNGGLVLNANAAALPAPLGGTMLQIGQVDNSPPRIEMDSFGTSATALTSRRSRGTGAAPNSALLAGDPILLLNGAGNDGTGYSGGQAQITLGAVNGWSATDHSANILFATTAPATTTQIQRAALGQGFYLGNPAGTVDPGVGGLVLNANAAALPAQSPGMASPNFRVGAADGNHASILVDCFGTGPQPFINTRVARGTAAAPTASQAFDSLLNIGAWGHNGTAYAGEASAQISVQANENWTPTANGARIVIQCVPNGSTTTGLEALIQSGFQIGSPTGGAKGVGSVNAQSMFVNNVAVSTSDQRLKENIEPSSADALAVLREIMLFDYTWRSTGPDDRAPRHDRCGFVAQQVPEQLRIPGPTDDDMVGVDTLQLLAHTVRAIQQLADRVAGLEARIA